jgi:type VI protein secretion system component Hcp
MSNIKYTMTIDGLLVESVEMQIRRFSFGLVANQSLNTPPPLMPAKSQNFTILRDSDKSSILFQQASVKGKAMQVIVAEIEQLKGDWLNRVTYSFSNAVIRNIQSSGTGAAGFIESLQFDSEGIDIDYSPTPSGSSYKGSHKGKQSER